MLGAEMEVHLADPGEREARNHRNGTSRKTVDTGSERIVLDIPRDRQGRFDPVLIGKYQRRFPGFDEKIIAMYARGMSTRDIQAHIEELYGIGVSAALVSAVTDAVVDGLKGFPEAITSVFPDCVVQTCIVHLIRYSLQFASWKERKPLARALKVIYAAASTEAAAAELDRFEVGPYGERYAAVVHSWRRRWEQVCGESGVAHACSSPSIATSKTGITAVS